MPIAQWLNEICLISHVPTSGNSTGMRGRNSARIENSEWGEAGIPREYIGVRKWSVIYERYFGDVVGFVDLAEVVDLLGVEGVVAYCRRLRRF